MGLLKVNTDVGCLGEAGTGIGMIVRDWEGQVSFVAAMRENEKWSPQVAEGRAVLFAVAKMKESRLRTNVIESDCQILVTRLQNQTSDYTEMATICQQIREEANQQIVEGSVTRTRKLIWRLIS
ncbi:unnamed protein product [Linum trigynum]|uniref:RNase H type-1 domain-containing protein n=1 Tax=Linum trigynum TaxID=586398 RepID=A0AAV2E0V5_9ROSI